MNKCVCPINITFNIAIQKQHKEIEEQASNENLAHNNDKCITSMQNSLNEHLNCLAYLFEKSK